MRKEIFKKLKVAFIFVQMLALVSKIFANGIDDFSLFATDTLFVKNNTNYNGQGKIGANKVIDIGNDAQIKGTLESGNNILLNDRSKIDGNVTAAGIITLKNQVQVTGVILPNSTVPQQIIPIKTVTSGTDSIALGNYDTITLEPGNYGELHAFSQSRLKLKDGSYNFKKFIIEPDVIINIDLPVGTKIEINIDGLMYFGDRSKLITEGEEHISDISIYCNYLANIYIGNSCIFSGKISAPYAHITVGSQAMISGTIWAKKITVDPQVYITGEIYSLLGDEDKDGVPLYIESILGSDSLDSNSFPLFVRTYPNLLIDATCNVKLDFSKDYVDYSNADNIALTVEKDDLENDFMPVITVSNNPPAGVVLPADEEYKIAGRFINYEGELKPGKAFQVVVPFPDDNYIIPEMVDVYHYSESKQKWEIEKQVKATEDGVYADVLELGTFACAIRNTNMVQYVNGTVYTKAGADATTYLEINSILNSRWLYGPGTMKLTYTDREMIAKTVTYEYRNASMDLPLEEQSRAFYVINEVLSAKGSILVNDVSFDFDGTEYDKSFPCQYLIEAGDRVVLSTNYLPYVDESILGDWVALTRSNYSVALDYEPIEGPGGVDGIMVPVYDGVTNTTSYTNKYFLKDHLGSTRGVIDDQGQLTEATVYTPYGMMDKIEQGTDVRDKFTGKEFDEEGSATGIPGIQAFYFSSRYYDPELGIFLSTDPQNVFWNSYSYCGGNPVFFVDPNGENPIPWIIGGIAMLYAGFSLKNQVNGMDPKYAWNPFKKRWWTGEDEKKGTGALTDLPRTEFGVDSDNGIYTDFGGNRTYLFPDKNNESKKGSQPKNSGDAIGLGEKNTDPVLVKQLSDAASVLETASYASDGTRWEPRAWMYQNENKDWAMGAVQPRLPGEPNDKFEMAMYGETMPNYTVRGINHYHWGDKDYHKNLSIDDVAELYDEMFFTNHIKDGFGYVFASSKHHVAVGRINLSVQYLKGIGLRLTPYIDGEYYFYVERSH